MNMQNYFLSSMLILTSFYSYSSEDTEKLYLTSFLKDYTAVRTYLHTIGFENITFKTDDNLILTGLFLSRPDARYTVILCSGWRPGRKEGMATFYDILPNDCNILLFDPRGRGQSEGSFFGKLWEYGIHEHRDIAAAITWANTKNTLPIIIIGMCSGAFNAAHTLLHLTDNNQLTESNVKGLVFDSGWGSVNHVSESAVCANIEEMIAAILKRIYTNKERAKESLIFKVSSAYTQYLSKVIHFLLARPIINWHEPATSLFSKIDQLNVPIFFIHSYDDRHAHIRNVKKLYALSSLKKYWWIKQSYHTQHHLRHKELYKEKLTAFIYEAIHQ